MGIELTLPHGGKLEFEPGLPSDYRGPILVGAVANSAKTKILEIIVQELIGEGYSIRYWICRFLKNLTLQGKVHNTGLHTFFNLLHDVRREVGSVGKMHLRNEQYACFISEPTTCKATFNRNTEYRSMDFYYSPKLIEEFIPLYPDLKSFFEPSMEANKFQTIKWSLPPMRELIDQFLNCKYDEHLCRLFMDLKVRELLHQVIRNEIRLSEGTLHFSEHEKERLSLAREILEGYLASKPPTIKELSKKVALNEFKLKTGFRKFFDIGIFEFLLEKKMHHAKHLLLTTNRPIKDICTQVGYPHTTNFITAFRRRFGITPGAIRRK